jgi:hypothetical protein
MRVNKGSLDRAFEHDFFQIGNMNPGKKRKTK